MYGIFRNDDGNHVRHATGELAVELGKEAKINMEDVSIIQTAAARHRLQPLHGLSDVVLGLQTVTAIVECETRAAV